MAKEKLVEHLDLERFETAHLVHIAVLLNRSKQVLPSMRERALVRYL